MTMSELPDLGPKYTRFRILVIGRANAGKTTLLNRVCNTTEDPCIYDEDGNNLLQPTSARGMHDIHRSFAFRSYPGLIFHDSPGLEAGDENQLQQVLSFIEEKAKCTEVDDQLHAIWFCFPLNVSRPLFRQETAFFETERAGKVPVIAIFTKFDDLMAEMYDMDLDDDCNRKIAEKQVEEKFRKPLSGYAFPPRADVCFEALHTNETDEHQDQVKALMEKTASSLDDTALKMFFVSVQQSNTELDVRYNMFSGSRNIVIHGGTFHQNRISRGMDILRESTATGAIHNSDELYDAPKCHPHTRVAVLDDIMKWVGESESARDDFILWLFGPAGSGKSAIAKRIAEIAAEKDVLIADFFFSRSSPTRNTPYRLIATIAFQLTVSIPHTRSYIEGAIERDPSIFTKNVQTQINTLLIKPFQSISSTQIAPSQKLIIIDGLDECNNSQAQVATLEAISRSFTQHNLPIKFLVVSRPESSLVTSFTSSEPLRSIHRRLALDSSYHPDDDIRLFFSDKFKQIRLTHPLKSTIPISWPTQELLDTLVRKSSGQFIYASTVVKFVESIRHQPSERLKIILGISPPGNMNPFAELDALYNHLLSSVDDIQLTLRVLSFYVMTPNFASHLRMYMSPELFLSLEPGHIHLSLMSLSSILTYDEFSGDVELLHVSLVDFLSDKRRSTTFYIDIASTCTDFVRRILQYVKGPDGIQAGDNRLFREAIELCSWIPKGQLRNDILNFDLDAFINASIRRQYKEDPVPISGSRIEAFDIWMEFLSVSGLEDGDKTEALDRLKEPFQSRSLKIQAKPISPPGKRYPSTELDGPYSHLLSSVDDIQLTLRVLSLYIMTPGFASRLRTYMSPELFLSLQPGDIQLALKNLSSIVIYHKSSGAVDILDPSIYDFLSDKRRSGPFYIDKANTCAKFVGRILQYVKVPDGIQAGDNYLFREVIQLYQWIPKGRLRNDILNFDLDAFISASIRWRYKELPFLTPGSTLDTFWIWKKLLIDADLEDRDEKEALDRLNISLESRLQIYKSDRRLQLLLTLAATEVMHYEPHEVPYCRRVDILLEMDDHNLHIADQDALDLRHAYLRPSLELIDMIPSCQDGDTYASAALHCIRFLSNPLKNFEKNECPEMGLVYVEWKATCAMTLRLLWNLLQQADNSPELVQFMSNHDIHPTVQKDLPADHVWDVNVYILAFLSRVSMCPNWRIVSAIQRSLTVITDQQQAIPDQDEEWRLIPQYVDQCCSNVHHDYI